MPILKLDVVRLNPCLEQYLRGKYVEHVSFQLWPPVIVGLLVRVLQKTLNSENRLVQFLVQIVPSASL